MCLRFAKNICHLPGRPERDIVEALTGQLSSFIIFGIFAIIFIIFFIILKIMLIILQEKKAIGSARFTHSVLASWQQTQAFGGGIAS